MFISDEYLTFNHLFLKTSTHLPSCPWTQHHLNIFVLQISLITVSLIKALYTKVYGVWTDILKDNNTQPRPGVTVMGGSSSNDGDGRFISPYLDGIKTNIQANEGSNDGHSVRVKDTVQNM